MNIGDTGGPVGDIHAGWRVHRFPVCIEEPNRLEEVKVCGCGLDFVLDGHGLFKRSISVDGKLRRDCGDEVRDGMRLELAADCVGKTAKTSILLPSRFA